MIRCVFCIMFCIVWYLLYDMVWYLFYWMVLYGIALCFVWYLFIVCIVLYGMYSMVWVLLYGFGIGIQLNLCLLNRPNRHVSFPPIQQYPGTVMIK